MIIYNCIMMIVYGNYVPLNFKNLQLWIVLKAACSFGRDCLRLYFLGFLLAGILKSQVTDGALSMNGLTWEVGVTLMQHGVMVQYFQNLLYCY